MQDELELQPADRCTGIAGAGHNHARLFQTSAIGAIAGGQAVHHRLAADAQLAFGSEGEDRVPLQLGQDERWRNPSHNPVEQAGQQRVGLGNEPPGGHVGGVSRGNRLEEGGVARDVGEQERPTTGSRVLFYGHHSPLRAEQEPDAYRARPLRRAAPQMPSCQVSPGHGAGAVGQALVVALR
jgi:hypothetical protein